MCIRDSSRQLDIIEEFEKIPYKFTRTSLLIASKETESQQSLLADTAPPLNFSLDTEDVPGFHRPPRD